MVLHPSLMVRAPLRPDPGDTSRLWAYYVEHRDEGVRGQLLAAYMSFTRMLAAKVFARRVFTEMEFGDYMQWATVGLLEAVDRFDPGRGVKFETFAASRITGSMLTGIESSSEIQQQIVARKRIVADRVASLRPVEALERPADIFARLAEIAVGLAVGFVLEGSGMYCPDDAETADNSYTGLELRQLQGRVAAAVRDLPPNQRQVIESHYLQHIQFEAIATAMSLSKGRIAQIHKQALGTLRGALQKSDAMDVHC